MKDVINMSEDIQLTKNFKKSEFACPCCGENKIEVKLVQCLQKLRDAIGKPIIINSGYRCLQHNKSLGSQNTSQHVKGKAADIRINGMTPYDVKIMAEENVKEFREGGIGIYNSFTHVDIRDNGPTRWIG